MYNYKTLPNKQTTRYLRKIKQQHSQKNQGQAMLSPKLP